MRCITTGHEPQDEPQDGPGGGGGGGGGDVIDRAGTWITTGGGRMGRADGPRVPGQCATCPNEN